MILHPTMPHDAGHDALREHLERDLRAALNGANGVDEAVGEIAAALATAWALDFRRATLPSLVYPLLASRLLCRLGRRGQAEHLLRVRVRAGGRTGMLLKAMEGGGLSLRACTLLADGVLRPAISAICLKGGTWVVDIDRLAGTGDTILELQMLARLRTVLGVAADLFDVDDGFGQLMLDCAHVRPGLPRGHELCGIARDVLARAGRDRGWAGIPGVHVQAPGRFAN